MADIEKLKVLAEAARTDNAMYGDPNDWQPSFGLSPAEQAFAEAASPAVVLELIATLQDYKRGAEVEAKLGDEARAERDQLCAEVEALRKDAERYRWLRAAAVREHGVAAEKLDAEFDASREAIDAAMAAKEGE